MKYLFSILLLALGLTTSYAQNLQDQLPPKDVLTLSETRSADLVSGRIVAKASGHYTVEVVNPKGEKHTMPLRGEDLKAPGTIDISVYTKGWKPGIYHVLVYRNGARTAVEKLVIK